MLIKGKGHWKVENFLLSIWVKRALDKEPCKFSNQMNYHFMAINPNMYSTNIDAALRAKYQIMVISITMENICVAFGIMEWIVEWSEK